VRSGIEGYVLPRREGRRLISLARIAVDSGGNAALKGS
jgi:hypothetical protein